ncbi:MAG: hypothetical protein H6716_09015 [Polyangiaceae bacterium]|nr:hypothetical protein [Polyangiaceae bacterium]
MSLRSPESARIERGALRFELGRAKVFTASQAGPQGTRDCELWFLDGGEALLSLAQRLLALGRHGIGRFSDYGLDGQELWLLREVDGTPLDTFVRAQRQTPEAWRLAERLRVGVQCARLLEECELSALFPGPMRPSELILDPAGRLHTRADTLVGSLLGLPDLPAHNTPGNSLSPRWLPPEQANGADWDALANRYVLGLVLYWLLAGTHAFAGLGLRHGLEEQRLRGAPPMPDDIARELPPGLQGLVLRLLEPDPDARPESASEVVERLEQFARELPQGNERRQPARTLPLSGEGEGVRESQVQSLPASSDPQIHDMATLHSAGSEDSGPQDAPAQVSVRALREHREERSTGEPVGERQRRENAAPQPRAAYKRSSSPQKEAAEDAAPAESSRRRGARPVPSEQPRGNVGSRALRTAIATAPVVLGLGIAGWLLHEPAQVAPESPVVKPQRPLDAAHTTSSDCASCHARQTAEWRRSVMAHSAKSPLFQGLEMLIQEQVGKDLDCPGGAGVLRRVDTRTACRDRDSGLPITGAGGEHWCVNCHSPGDNLGTAVPPWDGRSLTSSTRQPLKDLLPASSMEGISCAFCHQVAGGVRPGNQTRGLYEGNPSWTSFVDGRRFSMRPEDSRGRFGIANSGYFLDPAIFLSRGARAAGFEPSAFPGAPTPGSSQVVAASAELLGGAHLPIPAETKSYIQSSEFCGACHDVRLFGSDVLGARVGEHFKRLRNAYSEWVAYSNAERAKGKEPASCQDCHMSSFPGVCVPGEAKPGAAQAGGTTYSALLRGCPPGSHFEAREPGAFPGGHAAVNSAAADRVTPHYFSGVDVPLGGDFEAHLVNEDHIDGFGIPLGARARRDLLLGKTFRFELRNPTRSGSRLLIPVELENVGGGHRVPAGFSQEREFWVHLKVTDGSGRVVYEVGRVDRPDEDLHDKEFLRVNVRDDLRDGRGRPLGVFGADVADGRDLPRWFPDPRLGGTEFRGSGLINLQNGFLRCVVCIGRIDERGECQPGPGQSATRALRFTDGDYDIDTGECRSNLSGENALFETYFPIGSLDASRGVAKGPDAIIDRRSAPHGVPLHYTYDLPASGAGPFRVEAQLLFRAFPPFLIKAFAAYEQQMSERGQRPSGPLVTEAALERLEVVEIAKVEVELP